MERKQETFKTRIQYMKCGYKIIIPKAVWTRLPSDMWVVDETHILAERFGQTLRNHPISKSGNKRYIPIYSDDIETDYHELGVVDVVIRYYI